MDIIRVNKLLVLVSTITDDSNALMQINTQDIIILGLKAAWGCMSLSTKK